MVISKPLRLSNSKARTAMNAKISIFAICVKAIIYLLLRNLNDCKFKYSIVELMLSLLMAHSMLIVTVALKKNLNYLCFTLR